MQSKCNQNALKIPINSINSISSVDFDQSIQVELIFLIVLLVDNSGDSELDHVGGLSVQELASVVALIHSRRFGLESC
jgi:hypothetical protein